MNLPQIVKKGLVAIKNKNLKMQTAKKIICVCKTQIALNDLDEQTQQYKTLLGSYEEFTTNETLDNLIKNLSVTEFLCEQITSATFEKININFGIFGVYLSDFDSKRYYYSDDLLYTNIEKRDETFHIERDNDIKDFYEKNNINNVPFVLFKKFIKTVRKIFIENRFGM